MELSGLSRTARKTAVLDKRTPLTEQRGAWSAEPDKPRVLQGRGGDPQGQR